MSKRITHEPFDFSLPSLTPEWTKAEGSLVEDVLFRFCVKTVVSLEKELLKYIVLDRFSPLVLSVKFVDGSGPKSTFTPLFF